MADAPLLIHATAVALQDRAVLIRGASGTGKSALGLTLMALGCALVADDRVAAERRGDRIVLSCPAPLRGLIEARGVGLLRAEAVPEATLTLIVDLDQIETHRLPPRRTETCLGREVDLLHNSGGDHFAAAIRQYLKAGRSA